ncbi:HD domain-containing protein [Candidatus Kaiserbacteria bacterium]|nr:MAG: HD domain-containing protein [Candidatus Kaiserbacteria bacterium]
MRHSVPQEVLTIVTTLENAGFEAYLVGGCTRDLIRNKIPKDWDLTTNANPEEIQKIFPDSFYENDFGTVGVKTESDDPTLKVVEVTPYRIESTYSNARHPDEVTFSKNLTDDLQRRDFTMNAIAYNPTRDELVDPYKGVEDIRLKRIVTVGEATDRFTEDALRMMRAIRLAAELNFTIESKTASAIAEHAQLIEKVSQERVRDELMRIVASDTPMQAVFFAQRLGLMEYIIPELKEGIGCEQNQAHSYDVFEHLMRSLQHAADKNYSFDVRLAALLHDIGKPESRRRDTVKNDYTFYGHEVIGARMTRKILRDLKFPKDTAHNVEKLVRWHMFFSDPDQITLSAVRRMIQNVGVDHIQELLELRTCDRIGTGRPKEQPFRFRKYKSMVDEALRDPISVAMLKINGDKIIEILGDGPGPKVGWILHALLEEVLDEPKQNTPEYLEDRAAELAQLPINELQKLGEKGKDRREEEDEKEIEALRKKHHVS